MTIVLATPIPRRLIRQTVPSKYLNYKISKISREKLSYFTSKISNEARTHCSFLNRHLKMKVIRLFVKKGLKDFAE